MLKIIRKIRRYQYKSAKRLGDVQAVLQGKIVQRVAQRKVGAMSRKGINKLLPTKRRR